MFGPQTTIQLADQVMKGGRYVSGSETLSQTLGAGVVIANIDGARGYAIDYNITSLTPVIKFT